MDIENASGEIIKVEVVNFDTLQNNTIKIVVGAIAGTIVTKLVEKSMESYFAKKAAKKRAAMLEANAN